MSGSFFWRLSTYRKRNNVTSSAVTKRNTFLSKNLSFFLGKGEDLILNYLFKRA